MASVSLDSMKSLNTVGAIPAQGSPAASRVSFAQDDAAWSALNSIPEPSHSVLMWFVCEGPVVRADRSLQCAGLVRGLRTQRREDRAFR